MAKSALFCVGVLSVFAARSAEAQMTTADRFQPLVAATITDSTAQCVPLTAIPLQPDERGFGLRFGTKPSALRNVSAIWDTTGHLRRYSELRGDLRGPPLPPTERGASTMITINFDKGMALLMNEANGRSQGTVLTTPASAVAAPHLGPPRDMLARLHTQCGAPAPTP